MRINLFVAQLEDKEVKQLWEKTKELSKRAYVASVPVVTKAYEASKPVVLNVADKGLKYTVIGTRYVAEGALIAADAVQGARDAVRKAR